MQGIFINYRRDDTSGYSRLLYDRLVREFGKDQVFMDVETIREPGTDFVEAINEGVGNCTVLLALIGRSWVTGTDRDGRPRLDDPADFVRLEVASALTRDVRVIPIVVQGARMPSADDLPDDLKPLARRQALKLSHEDWEYDIGKLVDALAKFPELKRRPTERRAEPAPPPGAAQPPSAAATPPVSKGWSTQSVVIAALGTLVVGFVALLWIGLAIENTPEPVPPNPGPGPTVKNGEPQEKRPPEPQSDDPSTAYSDDVATAQRLLSMLDYSPGPADGLIGSATVAAVRGFQQDEGYPVTGSVNSALLGQLNLALENAAANPTTYAPPAPEAPAASISLAGTWYDNSGTPVVIEQYGNQVRVGAFDPMSQQVTQIGTGTISGTTVTIRYAYPAMGVSGQVVASMAPDGRHLNGTDTMDSTGVAVPNSWHLEHLPGQ